MLCGEDDTVVADSQPPVVATGQCGHLPGKGCGVLGILLDLGDDSLSVSRVILSSGGCLSLLPALS